MHLGILVTTAAVLGLALLLAARGVPMGQCLLVVMAAPLVTVFSNETRGHRHVARAIADRADDPIN